MKRGDVYFADLSPVVGSEQGGLRPVVIVQNNKGNLYAPTVIIAAITAQLTKNKLPTHIDIDQGVSRESVILTEQIRTIDKKRLKEKICSLDSKIMDKVDKALCISFGIS
ncbi:MAG: type II toxin-antitoxin system PemK/MazF family toxin [Lactobacillales bacterium]|jgi:mRNA interferase MazF|nr:type II toxin-antitoxin system PemK/MazF family toxin [Lactobacillales bacterium]